MTRKCFSNILALACPSEPSMALHGVWVSRKYLQPSRESASCWVPQLTWEQRRKPEESLFAPPPEWQPQGPLGRGLGPWQLRLRPGRSFVLNSQWQDAQLRASFPGFLPGRAGWWELGCPSCLQPWGPSLCSEGWGSGSMRSLGGETTASGVSPLLTFLEDL